MVAEIGQPAPDFRLKDQTGEWRTLADLAGSKSMVMFMPYAFTSTCRGEVCELRDNLHYLDGSGAKVFVITCDTRHSNRRWSEDLGLNFPMLSDFWPHGEVSRAYGCFNEKSGAPMRSTYILDQNGMVTDIVKTDRLDEPRQWSDYMEALSEE
jgi:peroxiredoxin